MQKLLLFDIHGTLIDSDNYLKDYESQMTIFATDYFGKDLVVNFDGYHGLTERHNLKDIFGKQGLDIKEQELDDFFNYSGHHYEVREDSVTLLLHVAETLEKLYWPKENQDYTLALVTGSQKLVARKCLDSVGIGRYFPFGAFGNQSHDRSKLVRKAINEFPEQIERSKIYIIGDTPRDIEAGKKQRAKTVGVLTGSGTREQLEQANADYIIPDFSELESLLKSN